MNKNGIWINIDWNFKLSTCSSHISMLFTEWALNIAIISMTLIWIILVNLIILKAYFTAITIVEIILKQCWIGLIEWLFLLAWKITAFVISCLIHMMSLIFNVNCVLVVEVVKLFVNAVSLALICRYVLFTIWVLAVSATSTSVEISSSNCLGLRKVRVFGDQMTHACHHWYLVSGIFWLVTWWVCLVLWFGEARLAKACLSWSKLCWTLCWWLRLGIRWLWILVVRWLLAPLTTVGRDNGLVDVWIIIGIGLVYTTVITIRSRWFHIGLTLILATKISLAHHIRCTNIPLIQYLIGRVCLPRTNLWIIAKWIRSSPILSMPILLRAIPHWRIGLLLQLKW